MKKLLITIKNRITLKNIINALIFIIFLVVTFYLVFRKNNLSEIIVNIKGAHKSYILMSIGCMFLYIFLEGVNVHRILKTYKDDVNLIKTFKYSLVGFFFSSITPSSTGGQPMQLYFMNKDKVPLAHGTLALLIQLLSFQFVTLILALIGFFFNKEILLHHIGNIKYLMFFGITVNIIIEAFLIIMIFSRKMGLKLINGIYKILKRMHYKKSEELYKKALVQLDEYHSCAVYLNDNKMLLVKTIVTSLLQMSLYHSVPYFIYRAFGLNDYSIFTFILMEAVLYISVASLPFPGAMGASEGSFMIIFKMFFPASILSSAMIISRGISFYLFVLISLFLIILFILIDNYKNKEKNKNLNINQTV